MVFYKLLYAVRLLDWWHDIDLCFDLKVLPLGLHDIRFGKFGLVALGYDRHDDLSVGIHLASHRI